MPLSPAAVPAPHKCFQAGSPQGRWKGALWTPQSLGDEGQGFPGTKRDWGGRSVGAISRLTSSDPSTARFAWELSPPRTGQSSPRAQGTGQQGHTAP